MRAPSWWQARPSALAILLRPASLIYGTVAARRLRKPGERAPLPVICIGNFTAGGAGKTPAALATAEILHAAGETPAFLSRGYGGRLEGPVRVNASHTASEVGDEPLLLAARAPVFVSRDRPAGAKLAHETGASVVIMDDGLQNPSLVKDCAIAVVDGATGIGNGLPLPSGPLRAPMDAQWPFVDGILVIGEGVASAELAKEARRRGKEVFRAALVPDLAAAEMLRNRRVLAFAGIGRPEKFFDTLRGTGAILDSAHAFPDHHPYSPQELARLRDEAERKKLLLVTTQKDLARIAGAGADSEEFLALPVRLRLDDEEAYRDFILRRIGDRRQRSVSA